MVILESVVVSKSSVNNISGDKQNIISDEDFGEHRDDEVLPVQVINDRGANRKY